MTQHQFHFKTRLERERETQFLRNYGEIGIPAVLAASATRRREGEERRVRETMIANGNARD